MAHDGWDSPLEWRCLLDDIDGVDIADCVLIYDTTESPIVFAIWNVRRQRVEYVYAEITERGRRGGEETSANPDLREHVRSKGAKDNNGRPTDHCGHLLARHHGGRMVFYNLIPQHGSVNRGKFAGEGYHDMWTYIDEMVKEAFDNNRNARVEIQYRPIYDDAVSTTRPTQIHTLGRDQQRLFENVTPNYDDRDLVQSRGKRITNVDRQSWQSGQCSDAKLRKFERFDKDGNGGGFDMFGGKHSTSSKRHRPSSSQHSSQQSGNSTGRPGGDRGTNSNAGTFKCRDVTGPRFVASVTPVVGSVVDIMDAAEDFSEGRPLQGALNLASGVGFLAADLFTLGAASAINSTIKGGIKMGTKGAAVAISKQAVTLACVGGNVVLKALVRKRRIL